MSTAETNDLLSVFLNGRARQVRARQTLAELAAELQIDPRRLLIEINGETLARSDWPGATLCHGDRVELICVVAGG